MTLTTFTPVSGSVQRVQNLVAAVARGVLHGDDHALGAGHQVHRAAHALDHLAGNHPVGEAARFVHLQRAEDGQVDVPAAHHRERLGAVEIGAARQLGDGFLAGVDQIGIDFLVERIGADAEHAVLRVQRDIHAGGDVVGHERRHADAKVDVVAVLELARDAPGDAFANVHDV